MALASWDIYKHNDCEASLYTTAPIEGSGSYLIEKDIPGSNRCLAMRHNIGGERNYLAGAIEALFFPLKDVHGGTTRSTYGISFLWQADSSPAESGDSCSTYLCGYDTTDGWTLRRYPNNLVNAPTLLVTSIGSPSVSDQTMFSLRVVWIQDATVYGGVRIILSVGSSADFDDLVVIHDHVDTVAAGALMGASYGEGFAIDAASGSTPTTQFLIDKINGYEVTNYS